MNVAVLVAARPNFVKVAPLVKGLESLGVTPTIVHAGQHYDQVLSDAFIEELGIPEPQVNLEVGSGTHAYQTARTMLGVEEFLEKHRPDAFVVAGDVNATMGGAIAAAKCGVFLVHLEAGLRSFDRSMPEEINRVVADQLADLCLAPSDDAVQNLQSEGVPPERIALVGNCMIDSLLACIDSARSRERWRDFGVTRGGYALLTLHRPTNVDDAPRLAGLLSSVAAAVDPLPVIFPTHPRTARQLEELVVEDLASEGIRFVPPLPYLDFISLMDAARAVLTDSGGVQEETSVLGIPCITLRANTERPITVTHGTNRIAGTDPESILKATREALEAPYPDPRQIPLWDGKAGMRAAEAVIDALSARAGPSPF